MIDTTIRQLGCSESPFASYTEHNGRKQLAQTAVAIASLTSSYEERFFQAAIKQAVNKMKAKYAILSCGIKQTDEGEFNLVKSDSDSLNYEFITLPSEDDAWEVFQHQAQTGIPEFETSLYQITLIQIAETQRYFLIANAHHSLADGFVYDKILGEILNGCKSIINNDDADNTFVEKQRPVVEPIETFFKADLSKWSFIKLMFRMTWRSIGRGKPIYILEKARNTPWTERKGVYTRVQYQAKQLDDLKNKARQHSTTINGCIAAAMILAFEKLRTPTEQKHTLRVGHAVDLRRRLPNNEMLTDNLFCAASGVNTYHEAGTDKDFWTLAKTVRNDLHNEIEKHRTPWRVLAAMQEVPDLFKWANEPYSGRSETLGISNIGQVAACQKVQCQELIIDSVFIAGSIQIVGGLVSVIVTTINDSLCFSFMACDPLITQKELSDFANDVISRLDGC